MALKLRCQRRQLFSQWHKHIKCGDGVERSLLFAFANVSLSRQVCQPCFARPLPLCKPFGWQHARNPLVLNHQRRCIGSNGDTNKLAAPGQLGVLSAAWAALGRFCRCSDIDTPDGEDRTCATSSPMRTGVNSVADAGTAASSATTITRRVVSIGDLHGDFEQAKFILEWLGMMAKDGSWAGGDTVLVQTGDVTDRGDASGPIYEALFRLQDEAPQQGGEVILLLGNHELLNMQGCFVYATARDTKSLRTSGRRNEAFAPDGWIGRRLRDRAKTVVLLDKEHGIPEPVFFAHAGVVPEIARAARDAAGPDASGAEVAEALNRIGRMALAGGESVLRGSGSPILGESGPFWTRELSLDSEATACQKLDEVLQTFGAARMVVGHTPQIDGRVRTRCGGRLVLGDTLISAAYTGVGHPSAVEVRSDGSMMAVYPETGTRCLLPKVPALRG